jgi:hypothetical protein
MRGNIVACSIRRRQVVIEPIRISLNPVANVATEEFGVRNHDNYVL